MYHPAKVMRCSNYEFSTEDEESLKSHMTECHVGMEAGWHMYKMCLRCSNWSDTQRAQPIGLGEKSKLT